MPAKEEKHVVITGVSSGIGFALATVLIKSGYKVYGSIRKQLDADRLAKELGPNFTPLLFDVTDEGKIKVAAEKVNNDLHMSSLEKQALMACAQPFEKPSNTIRAIELQPPVEL